MISQLKPNYMYNLNLYKKTIEQRNKYLRQIREENKTEKLLDIWDEKLVEYADQIYKYRKYYIEKIKEILIKFNLSAIIFVIVPFPLPAVPSTATMNPIFSPLILFIF